MCHCCLYIQDPSIDEYLVVCKETAFIIINAVSRSRIHKREILLRFLGIILRVLNLEASIYNVYITNQFRSTFAQRGGGDKSIVEVTVNSKDEKLGGLGFNYV
jgi:hypothetical protein